MVRTSEFALVLLVLACSRVVTSNVMLELSVGQIQCSALRIRPFSTVLQYSAAVTSSQPAVFTTPQLFNGYTSLTTWYGCLGYTFTPQANKSAYALGFADWQNCASSCSTGDGLKQAHQVGLYRQTSATTGTLLASVTVPAGTGGYLIDNARYQPLNQPIALIAGQQYSVCGLYTSTDMTSAGDCYASVSSFYFNAGFVGGMNTQYLDYVTNLNTFPSTTISGQAFLGGNLITACEVCSTLQYHYGDACIGPCTDCVPCNPGETMTTCSGPGAVNRTCVDPTGTTLVRPGASPTMENGYTLVCLEGMRGIEFTTAGGPIVGLGVYDGPNLAGGAVGDGLWRSHQVGLWDGTGTTLLASVTVPALGGSLAGAFRFAALASPLTLAAGTYVVAAQYAAADCTAQGDVSAWQAVTSATFSTPFTGVRGRSLVAPNFAFPTVTDAANVYFGASVSTACRTCGPTQYMSGDACLGNCTACSCPSGQFMSSQCSASSTSNNPACSACTCPAGTYVSAPCSGKTLTNSPTCAACTSCAAYYHIASCSGPGAAGRTCAACSCPSGQYMLPGSCPVSATINSPICAACTVCPSGQYPTTPCTGTTTSANQGCTACTPCGAGLTMTSCTGPGTAGRVCMTSGASATPSPTATTLTYSSGYTSFSSSYTSTSADAIAYTYDPNTTLSTSPITIPVVTVVILCVITVTIAVCLECRRRKMLRASKADAVGKPREIDYGGNDMIALEVDDVPSARPQRQPRQKRRRQSPSQETPRPESPRPETPRHHEGPSRSATSREHDRGRVTAADYL